MYIAQHTMYIVQHTMYYIQCTMYYIQCTMYNVLYLPALSNYLYHVMKGSNGVVKHVL